MLRFHLQRLILASALLLPLVGAGVALSPSHTSGQIADALPDASHSETLAASATHTMPAMQSLPSRPARPNERHWTFFSFGSRGAR